MITTVTLNVAIDKAYVVEEIKLGQVMRVKECSNTAGGKGLNVAKAVKLCGEDICAAGFAGGHAGAYVVDMLEACGVPNKFVKTAGETRSCINILTDDGKSTEFLEPGIPVTEYEVKEFVDGFYEIIENSDVITISGSIPKGVPEDIYSTLIRNCKAEGKKVVLDTSGDLLKEGIKSCPTVIKPNSDEIEELLNIKVNNRQELIAGAKRLQAMGIEIVIVSLGAEGAIAVTEQGIYHGKPPQLEVVNTVGCGDSMVAGIAVGLKRGYSIREMLAYAVAVSAANALTMVTGHFYPTDMEDIVKRVVIEELS